MKLVFVMCCFGVVLSLPIENPEPTTNDITPEDPAAAPASRVPDSLNLPSNATSIRSEISDTFSCQDRIYGYYADVDNDCQIFHICLPVTYADGKEKMFRWSFVCPDETIFSQEHFTCIRPADWAGNCADTEKFIDLNKQFGQPSSESEEKIETDSETSASSSSYSSSKNESLEATLTNADSVPQEKPLEKSFSVDTEQILPESESLSYGIFNVRDPLSLRSDTDAIDHVEITQNHEDDSVVTTEAVDDLALEWQTTTEESSDHSTDIWNMYTESLYDGSTIDDIVEVNAVGLQNIDSTTETLESADK